MALSADDLTAIGELIDQRVVRAVSGGPVVQYTPRDLVYLGNGQYVSAEKNSVYRKDGRGGLALVGDIPDPV